MLTPVCRIHRACETSSKAKMLYKPNMAVLASLISLALLTHSKLSFADDLEQQQLEIAGLYVDLMKDMPEHAKLINSPYPQGIGVYGTKGKIDKKSVIKGGRALRIQISKAGKRSYDKGATIKTIDKINSGDLLCLTFWARSINPPEENLTAELASVGVQQASEPYRRLLENSALLSYDWTQYSSKSVARQSYDAEQAEVFFHFGHLKQRLEIGPTYLFNLGGEMPTDFQSNACGK